MAADREGLPRWQRVYAFATAAVIGGALAYALCDWSGWPRLTLDPYRGGWSWPDGPTRTVPINYYGTLLWGAGGAAVGAGLAALATWRRGRPLPATILVLLAAWALTAFVLAGGFYTWSLWPF